MREAEHAGRNPGAIPIRAGIGLRTPHCREIVESRPDIGWVEVHSENYFCEGGQPHRFLELVRADCPLSLHGVGLGLGSAEPLDLDHLRKLGRLIDRYQPGLVSEHLCWSAAGGRHLNDLLPLPYTEEALAHVCDRIEETQRFLGRQIQQSAGQRFLNCPGNRVFCNMKQIEAGVILPCERNRVRSGGQ